MDILRPSAVHKVDRAIHCINLHPVDDTIILVFLILIYWKVIFLVYSASYPPFEQLPPDLRKEIVKTLISQG